MNISDFFKFNSKVYLDIALPVNEAQLKEKTLLMYHLINSTLGESLSTIPITFTVLVSFSNASYISVSYTHL
ncbi:hypothetical protein, partial [Serratia sp. 14-2641]|uniref:hypothetical protein n=1 Tax=Serratia sp. 14-2641 TaxID=1841657 RepID=UPI001A7E0BB3